MTDAEHLADLRERFGPGATRVGDLPTAGDVAMLLRMLDRPRCVDDTKVAEIREAVERLEYSASRCQNPTDKLNEWKLEISASECRTLLAALDAERVRAEKADQQLAEFSEFMRWWLAPCQRFSRAKDSWFNEALEYFRKRREAGEYLDAIERGEHRDERDA